MKRSSCVLAVLICACTYTISLDAQTASGESPLQEAVLAKLPPLFRGQAEQLHLRAPDAEQETWLRESAVSPKALLSAVIGRIAAVPDGLTFLLKNIKTEPEAENRLLFLERGLRPRVRDNPPPAIRATLGETLEDLAHNDSSVQVSLEAIENLRMLQAGVVGRITALRAEKARAAGDSAGEQQVLQHGDDWLTWDEQVRLPNFLRTPPPVFEVAPENKSIHVLSFGDFGNGSPAQKQLAKVMANFHQQKPFDFGLTLGDNIYPSGVDSTEDPQWQTKWEDVYSSLNLKFYASLGNHDYKQADSPAAEILYSKKSKSWVMPSTFYTYTAGPVQFFAIDTVEMENAQFASRQLDWLKTEMAKSHSRWKVVYGHYQVYSATRGDEKAMITYLLPILKDHADLYLCGHDHNLQELKEEAGVHFFVSGGGGASLYDFRHPNYSHSVFKAKANGFSIIDADQDQMIIRLIGLDGKELNKSTIKKN